MAQFISRNEKNSDPTYDGDRLLISSIGERPEDTASHEPIALARERFGTAST
jgi:hypothetical protein